MDEWGEENPLNVFQTDMRLTAFDASSSSGRRPWHKAVANTQIPKWRICSFPANMAHLSDKRWKGGQPSQDGGLSSAIKALSIYMGIATGQSGWSFNRNSTVAAILEIVHLRNCANYRLLGRKGRWRCLVQTPNQGRRLLSWLFFNDTLLQKANDTLANECWLYVLCQIKIKGNSKYPMERWESAFQLKIFIATWNGMGGWPWATRRRDAD